MGFARTGFKIYRSLLDIQISTDGCGIRVGNVDVTRQDLLTTTRFDQGQVAAGGGILKDVAREREGVTTSIACSRIHREIVGIVGPVHLAAPGKTTDDGRPNSSVANVEVARTIVISNGRDVIVVGHSGIRSANLDPVGNRPATESGGIGGGVVELKARFAVGASSLGADS